MKRPDCDLGSCQPYRLVSYVTGGKVVLGGGLYEKLVVLSEMGFSRSNDTKFYRDVPCSSSLYWRIALEGIPAMIKNTGEITREGLAAIRMFIAFKHITDLDGYILDCPIRGLQARSHHISELQVEG